jgi:hypothetical protein
VETFGTLREWYGDWHLGIGCRPQTDDPLCKGHSQQGPGRDSVARGVPKDKCSRGDDRRAQNATR